MVWWLVPCDYNITSWPILQLRYGWAEIFRRGQVWQKELLEILFYLAAYAGSCLFEWFVIWGHWSFRAQFRSRLFRTILRKNESSGLIVKTVMHFWWNSPFNNVSEEVIWRFTNNFKCWSVLIEVWSVIKSWTVSDLGGESLYGVPYIGLDI